MELKLTVDGLEKERDFYFSKLRDIELICQEHESENNPILSKIIDILYATEVSDHFQPQTNKHRLHLFNLLVLYLERITAESQSETSTSGFFCQKQVTVCPKSK